MREADAVLGIIRDRGQRQLPLEDVYRQLFNPSLYLKAYGKIYRNAGAMTQGTTEENVDGMSLAKIETIIEAIRYERFRWTPVRRTYIPKKDGKKRPLGIPTWTDKLVQEVVRMLLEAYYEPQFADSSHGFRPKRGCHTALYRVYYSWKGTKWFIEGDIRGCFDNIDHEILLAILSEKIHDNRFLRLMGNLLKAGYCEQWTYKPTLSGTPQGGIVSPILANIYLDRLDKFIEETLTPEYTRGDERRINPEYHHLQYLRRDYRRAEDFAKAEEVLQRMRQIPRSDPDDPDYRRLRYVRYADDFLLGFIGPKAEAEEIRSRLATFLRDILKLELSAEKTLITHAQTERAKFLGYEIYTQHADDKITNNRRAANCKIGLRMPTAFLEKTCQNYMKDGKPSHRAEFFNDDDFSIVMQYQSELRGYYQYFQLATNICSLHRLRWVMEASLLKTLANKHKASTKSIVKKYKTMIQTAHGPRKGIKVEIPRSDKEPLIAIFGGMALRRNVKAAIQDPIIQRIVPRNELIKRLLAEECEVCGAYGCVEVHHIRALKDLNKPGRKPKPPWMQLMSKRRRKTLVLCPDCHDDLHAGKPLRYRDRE